MTYTYRCKDCGADFDVKHGMNETPRIVHCSSDCKKVVMSPTGIHGANSGNREGT